MLRKAIAELLRAMPTGIELESDEKELIVVSSVCGGTLVGGKWFSGFNDAMDYLEEQAFSWSLAGPGCVYCGGRETAVVGGYSGDLPDGRGAVDISNVKCFECSEEWSE